MLDFAFAPVPLSIIPRKDIEWIDKVLLGRLIFRAGKNGVCRPRQGTLALEFGVHRQRINERLGVLEEKGFISSKRTPGAKRYYINLPLVTGGDVRQTRHQMSDKPEATPNPCGYRNDYRLSRDEFDRMTDAIEVAACKNQ
jgi:hypothetical protein